MTAGLWPKIQVNGRLESAEMEWLHTNGAGAYAMSTVAMHHTRRYHGILVAALSPPVDRHVIVSHVEAEVHVDNRAYRLAVQQSPHAAPTPGYRFLEFFEQSPIPRWTYRIGKNRLVIVLALVRGRNAAVLGYSWKGTEPASLTLRPLLPLRPMHLLTREHGAMVQRIRLRSNQVEIRPVAALPPVVFRHEGVFIGSPDWYRRFEYAEDKLRRVPCEEDLWTPGSFEIPLTRERTAYLTIGVDRVPEGDPRDLVAEAAQTFMDADPGFERPLAVRELSVAAEQFCADSCDAASIIAGYPWLTATSRDELLALPGLYLVRGKVTAAKRVLATLVDAMKDGLLPRRIRGRVGAEPAPSADATLLLFEATREIARVVGLDDPFLWETLYPALAKIFARVREPRREVLWLDDDGLVVSGDDDVAYPWLDAGTGATLGATRRGLTVEHQAFFSKGLETLSGLAAYAGDRELSEAAGAARVAAKAAFRRRFWCDETRYPYDCLRRSEGEEIADRAIRPNALVALDVDAELFEHWQAAAILERVRERLLTSRGVRSLDPEEPGYRGEYEGSFEERRLAHHQGLAWTRLLGAYARASLRVTPDDFDLEEDLRVRIERARTGGPVLGQVCQFSDGEAPHHPGGCPAEATSVAELLRTLVWDLGL